MNATASVRIVIADPQPIFRDGLGRLLQTDAAFIVVGHTSALSATVRLVRDLRPDVLLLGVDASGEQSIDTLRALAQSGLPVRTILLVDRVERTDVSSALQLGVRSVIPKDSSADMLFKIIRDVVAGTFEPDRESPSNPAADVQRLAAARRRRQAFSLTRRETEILCRIAEGLSNKDIAVALSISENTVKSHVGHLFNKLGASNRLELALFAKHHRLLDGV